MWAYDGSRNVAAGEKKLSRGTTFVVAAVVVELPFLARPIALPVLARLWRPGGPPKTALARQLISLLADARRDRRFHVVADGAYLCTALRHLPANVTLTGPLPATRRSARSTPMSTTGSVARPAPHPRHEDRPPPPDHRHHAGPTGHGDPLRPHQDRQHLALVTTDPTTASEQVIERYAARWAIEVTFADAKQAPQGTHRCAISCRPGRQPHPRRNPDHPPGLGRRRSLSAKHDGVSGQY